MSALLFFVAILPDEGIQQQVTGFKSHLARHFNASHALKSPPHITLFPPFQWAQGKTAMLQQVLDDFAIAQHPFQVELKNFGCFAPRVIFVNVVKNLHLTQLHAKLVQYLEKKLNLRNDRPYAQAFKPHMTIAHKDLQKELFPDAWQYFSDLSYTRTVEVTHLALLRYEKPNWNVFQMFPLGT